MPFAWISAESERTRLQSLVAFLKRVGEKAPKSPKEMGSLRLRLVQAQLCQDK